MVTVEEGAMIIDPNPGLTKSGICRLGDDIDEKGASRKEKCPLSATM